MKSIKIDYLIDTVNGSELATGFAVAFAPVRFCVRERYLMWVCDHYDTGRCFGPLHDSKESTIAHGIKILERSLASGKYADVMNAYNRGDL